MNAIFYRMACPGAFLVRWYVPGQSDPVADGLLTEWVQEAFDRITAQTPTVLLAPSPDRFQLTGMASWLAIEEGGFARLDGAVSTTSITVEAWLDPVEVVWDMGNGDVQICGDAGTPYDTEVAFEQQRPSCSYVYTTTPSHLWDDPATTSFPMSVAVSYRAGYRVTGAPGLDGEYALGLVDGPASELDVEVRELRAVRVDSRL